jgi:hypothetical protein
MILGDFDSNYSFFEKNTHFLQNSDHNVDPWNAFNDRRYYITDCRIHTWVLHLSKWGASATGSIIKMVSCSLYKIKSHMSNLIQNFLKEKCIPKIWLLAYFIICPNGENLPNPVTLVTIGLKIFISTRANKVSTCCPGGVAQWTSHPPQERKDPGSNPARV